MKTIRVLSRDSRLAVAQSEMVIDAIRRYDAELPIELITMKTSGDLTLDRTLDEVGGKGLFVKELDAALLDGRGDISVHSYKDMPTEDNPRLPVVAVSERGDPRDALVLPVGVDTLDLSKPIGCSSKRRALQLANIYPNARVEPVRGNVPTRLRKLDEGQYSALTLAAAGLKRLKLEDRISRVFEINEIIPAACQGIIAVQDCAGTDTEYLKLFRDESAEKSAAAERAFIRQLGADCFAAVAVYAELSDGNIHITAMFNGRYGNITVTERDGVSGAIELARRLSDV
ncbi:MAG: hydroxymethylbilane synthase [Oscillospiraceae bacterium]|jgi:hydroxymethylbilane synthase|nr:hydroxymethylbilane synthase [Oscillospiraceae bacterium]